MWYSGRPDSHIDSPYKASVDICRASSRDGLTWTPHTFLPAIRFLESADFEAFEVSSPWHVEDRGSHHVWMTVFDGANRRVGYAFSRDDLPWQYAGDGGLWLFHETGLSDPSVVRTPSGYFMAFTRWDMKEKSIGFASSFNAFTWERESGRDQDITPGDPESWDSRQVWCPSLCMDPAGYRLWYVGTDGHEVCLGQAVSGDGRRWRKHPANPLFRLGVYTGFERETAWSVTVVPDRDAYTLYYSTPADADFRRASSPDGIRWRIDRKKPQMTGRSPADRQPGRIHVSCLSGGYRLTAISLEDQHFHLHQAMSKDGCSWPDLKDSGLRIRQSPIARTWQHVEYASPCVLRRADAFHLWFAGLAPFDVDNRFVWQIGHATSPDGHDWDFDGDAPVLQVGLPGAWDSRYVTDPWVLWDGRRFRMWYTGYDGAKYGFGHAVSQDGHLWKKDPDNPVFSTGSGGAWDEDEVRYPCVLKSTGRFHLWYCGRNGLRSGIGYASSRDGRKWNRHPDNPALTGESQAQWAVSQLTRPCVVEDRRGHVMWYTGFDWKTWNAGKAISPDGIHWKPAPENPVFTAKSTNAWDSQHVVSPCVVPVSGRYYMWYAGGSADQYRIGMATSEQGIDWMPIDRNPVLEPTTQGWDSHGMNLPRVLFHDGLFRMWYSGNDGFQWRIGYAVSKDGVRWERHPASVLEGTPEAWDSDGVWGASVLWEDGRFLMWYTGTRRQSSYPDLYEKALFQVADIGLAVSTDGIHWVKQGSGPVLQNANTAWVLRTGGLYRMWSTYAPRERIVHNNNFQYATSMDGITWRTHPNHPLNPKIHRGWGNEPCRASVLLAGDVYRLWFDAYNPGNLFRYIGAIQIQASDYEISS